MCSDSDWDCGEGDSQDGEDMLCNTVLITGPTGIGKTAAVYACAQELGFKVQQPFKAIHLSNGELHYCDSCVQFGFPNFPLVSQGI